MGVSAQISRQLHDVEPLSQRLRDSPTGGCKRVAPRAGHTVHTTRGGVHTSRPRGTADPETGACSPETLRDRLFVTSAQAWCPCHASVVVDSCLPERSVPLTALQSRSQELLGQDGFNSTSYLQVLFDSHKGCSVAIKAIFN